MRNLIFFFASFFLVVFVGLTFAATNSSITCVSPYVLNLAGNGCVNSAAVDSSGIDWSGTSVSAVVYVASMAFAFFAGIRAGFSA